MPRLMPPLRDFDQTNLSRPLINEGVSYLILGEEEDSFISKFLKGFILLCMFLSSPASPLRYYPKYFVRIIVDLFIEGGTLNA